MNASWMMRTHENAAQRWVLAPLVPLAAAYACGARLHRYVYSRGICAPRKLACKVVSVGNLVVGGSGKTPTTAWIATALRNRGWRVAIASRGYGRAECGSMVVVSDGEHIGATLDAAGDEPMFLARCTSGVPVLVGADRAEVGKVAVDRFGTQILLLDDGFQHHRLARDLDLLTLDARFGLGNGRVLPRGPLRESLSALSRADGFLLIDGPLRAGEEKLLRDAAPHAPRFSAVRVLERIVPLDGAPALSLAALRGAKVGLLSALANPASFRRSVEELGAVVVAERRFRDHHVYQRRDLLGLGREAPLWLTTEKDAVKLTPAWDEEALLHVVGLTLQVGDAEKLLSWIEEHLR